MNTVGNKDPVRRRLILLFVVAAAWMIGCKDPQDTDFHGTLLIKLVDAPAALEELEVVFSRVAIHRSGASDDLGWRIVSDDILIQDILELRNGRSRNLVSATVPEGAYDKIQVFFEISRLRDSGTDSPVFIPLSLSGGVTFDHVFSISEGLTTGITFDFDATRSVRMNTSGNYELFPIIRIQNTDLAGSIIGAIVPDSVTAIISTSSGADSITTFSLAQPPNNSFELVDLPEGTYTVSIAPADAAFRDTSISGVVVTRKLKTNLGAIVLRQQ